MFENYSSPFSLICELKLWSIGSFQKPLEVVDHEAVSELFSQQMLPESSSDETFNHLTKPITSFLSFVFIEVDLTYNITSVSGVQHGDSTCHDQVLNHLERIACSPDTSSGHVKHLFSKNPGNEFHH